MEDIMNIIIKVAATLLALGAGYLGKLLVGWLKSKLSDRDAAKLDLFISELCAAAEQMYRDADPDGTIRLNYVEGIFVADYVPLDSRIKAEFSRMVVNGKRYDILLIDNPMEMQSGSQLEIYLKFTGGQ